MRMLLRIFLTLLLAVPMLLAVVAFWALQGGRDAAPIPGRWHPISDERDPDELFSGTLPARSPAGEMGPRET